MVKFSTHGHGAALIIIFNHVKPFQNEAGLEKYPHHSTINCAHFVVSATLQDVSGSQQQIKILGSRGSEGGKLLCPP